MKLPELFALKKGKGEYRINLGTGKTPLVSATNVNNGVIDWVNLEPTFKAPAITVERVSGQAYVQTQDFCTVPDDLNVLVPIEEMTVPELLDIAAQINHQKWRYGYSRKLTATRLAEIDVALNPAVEKVLKIEDFRLRAEGVKAVSPPKAMKVVAVTDFFDLEHGDFHSLDALDKGAYPTVSRDTFNNGIVGYYDKPEGAELRKRLTLTIATTSGEAFLQLDDFLATDNVVILKPKQEYSLEFMLFIQLMINNSKWRYYYGRQCYKTRFAKTRIALPVNGNGEVDEDYISSIIKATVGYRELHGYVK